MLAVGGTGGLLFSALLVIGAERRTPLKIRLFCSLRAGTKYAFGRCVTRLVTSGVIFIAFDATRLIMAPVIRVCPYNWQLLNWGGWWVFQGFSILTMEFNNFDTWNSFRLCSFGSRLTKNSGSRTLFVFNLLIIPIVI